MKYFPLYIFAALMINTAWEQAKIYDDKSDTASWYSNKQEDAKRIGLDNLIRSPDSLHFRYWMENHAIEIWTNDYISFHGIVSIYTERFDKNSEKVLSNKFYNTRISMDSSLANTVYELFKGSNILQMSSDSKIKGWAQGDDGEEFLMEYSTRQIYSFRQYWTPSAQTGLAEALAIEKLNRDLRTKLNLETLWKNYLAALPKGCYKHGEMFLACNLTKNDQSK